jgi:hypothetical protein
MYKKVYKIAPLNNSFNLILEELTKHLQSEYDVDRIEYPDTSLTADGVQIGNPPYEPWHKPEFLYVTLNFCVEHSWTNDGGHTYCELYLKDKSKILINWNTGTDNKKIEEFSTKFIRKLKLKKLNSI